MKKILLIDDQPPLVSHHRVVFGPAADTCSNVAELRAKIDQGVDWTAAFIDFDLAGGGQAQPTGLSALRLLRQYRPATRRIIYTTFGESGRALFAAAAWHWFDTRTLVDKSAGEESVLRRAADLSAQDPTAPGWRERLTNHAFLIDHLFADHNWLELWRIWWSVNGSIRVAPNHLDGTHTQTSVRKFSQDAGVACLNFQEAFLGRGPRARAGSQTALATPLASFAHRHANFFNAVDLEETLREARPWQRSRAIRG